jgi:transcriptional regulator with XRE-family HTH domain
MSLARSHSEKILARRHPAARPPQGAAESPSHAVAGIGAKLKAARERNGISVRGFARNIDVSPSLVSQIENGLAMPSVGTLYAMVSELGLTLDELFSGKPKPPANGKRSASAVEQPGPVRRRNRREVIRLADGVRWELLTPSPDPELEFLYVVYEVGAESCDKDLLVRHGGMEYAYLLSGKLGVRIGFSEYELNAGDSISFDAQSPHRLWTIGRKPAVAIWAVLNRSGDKRTGRRHWMRAPQTAHAAVAGLRARKRARNSHA